jgi:hypothetical protein
MAVCETEVDAEAVVASRHNVTRAASFGTHPFRLEEQGGLARLGPDLVLRVA